MSLPRAEPRGRRYCSSAGGSFQSWCDVAVITTTWNPTQAVGAFSQKENTVTHNDNRFDDKIDALAVSRPEELHQVVLSLHGTGDLVRASQEHGIRYQTQAAWVAGEQYLAVLQQVTEGWTKEGR